MGYQPPLFPAQEGEVVVLLGGQSHRVFGEEIAGCPSLGQAVLVDWKSYGPEKQSWVPRSHIADPSYRLHPVTHVALPGGSC